MSDTPQSFPEAWTEALKVDMPVTADQLRRIRYAALNAEGTDQAIRDDLVALCDTVSALRSENAELHGRIVKARDERDALRAKLRELHSMAINVHRNDEAWQLTEHVVSVAASSHEARDRA